MKSWLHKIYHNYIISDDLYELIHLYDETQYWPFEKLKDLQMTKLKELLLYSFQNVPYYRSLFQTLKIDLHNIERHDSFQKIPFLTKDIIRENYSSLLSNSFDSRHLRPNATSGSTGTNLKFYSDKKDRHTQAMIFRNHAWMGLNYFDKKITIWGARWDVNKAKQFIPSVKKKLKGNLILSGYQLSDQMMLKYYEVITKFKPKLLRSYPSILYTLAIFYEKNDLKLKPIAIESAGEKLNSYQREKIENVFCTKIFDFYGARDIPLIAQECEEHNGLHIMMENVFLEVVNENGIPIKEGEGDLVLTHLHNRAMPFIRYRIGDRARISSRLCKCGRRLPLIEEVVGRSFDILEFPNGQRVGGTFWSLVMKSAPGIVKFQVIQKSITHIVVNYMPDHGITEENLNLIKKNILEFSGPMLNVDFRKVELIPETKGGKIQFVISELDRG